MFWFFIFIAYISIVIYSKRNNYISEHKKHLRNNKEYLKYLDWCREEGLTCKDKNIVCHDLDSKEKEIKDILNN